VTQPQPAGPPLLDPGNRWITPEQCDLTTGRMYLTDNATGLRTEYAVLTFRAGNSTMTLLVTKDELRSWIGSLRETHGKMSSVAIATPGGPPVPLPDGLRKGRG
jgi:hypothetical protein